MSKKISALPVRCENCNSLGLTSATLYRDPNTKEPFIGVKVCEEHITERAAWESVQVLQKTGMRVEVIG